MMLQRARVAAQLLQLTTSPGTTTLDWSAAGCCTWRLQQQQQQQPHMQQQPWACHRVLLHSQQQQQHSQQQVADAVQKVYRGKWILPVRFLVRAKVFQLMGGGSIGLVLGSLAMDDASLSDVFALAALAGGMVAASCCLWYYSRRYVGEMGLLLPDRARVRFSVLDFWGNRENVDVPVSAIVPPFRDARPKEVDRLASQLLFPVNVTGQQRQFYLSIHAGHIMEPQAFFSILKGNYSADRTADSQAQAVHDEQQPLEPPQPCQQQQQQQPGLKQPQAELPPPPPAQRMW